MGKKGKGNGGEKAKPVTDGILPIDMSRKQLLKHLIRLQDEIVKEREERNYFMLERERLYLRWNLYMEQIAIEKAKVQALKTHLANSAEEKRAADDLYEQKLRFLKAEQTRKLGQLRLLHLIKMAQAQDDAWILHMVMKEELMNKKKGIRRAQMAFYQIIRGLHWAHAKAVSDLRNDFVREIRRLEVNYDRNLFEKNDRLEEIHDKQLRDMAVAKEDQIKTLTDDHAWQADQMKSFFQELLKVSLDIVQQMKVEVKNQTTAELMQRRDYEHFKHRYDTYVEPALRWNTLMDSWVVLHQEDDLYNLVAQLNTKEEELKKRKFNYRMLEAANEALNQRMIIAEKERNCIKTQFCRAIADSQRNTSMVRFVDQLKRKAARDEAEVYFALNKLVHDRGTGANHFKDITNKKDEVALDLMLDINQQTREHLESQYIYADAFEDNEINLDDIGFPIQQAGVKHVRQQDLENLMEANQGWKMGKEEDEEVWWEEESVSEDMKKVKNAKDKFKVKRKSDESRGTKVGGGDKKEGAGGGGGELEEEEDGEMEDYEEMFEGEGGFVEGIEESEWEEEDGEDEEDGGEEEDGGVGGVVSEENSPDSMAEGLEGEEEG